MTDDYLGRALAQRVADVRQSCGAALDHIMRTNAAAGRLASGASLKMFTDETLGGFERAYLDAQQFGYNLTGCNDQSMVDRLNLCASEMIAAIMEQAIEHANRLGISGDIVPNQLAVIRHQLEDKRERLTDDFKHGMQGSERLKKDPVVSIVANQTGSPGAVQQVGVGDFSQSAFIQNHQQLVEAITKALASPEFAKLLPEHKEGFKDVADTLLDEAKKPSPDPGKLKRWGSRLSELSLQLGLEVAAGEIIELIGNMFP